VRYRTIVADPPWEYDAMPIGGATAGSFGATRPLDYPTLTIDEIRALPVSGMAEADAALWMWTTNRYLPQAFSVVDAWGFTYRQTLVWGKNNPMPVGSIAPSAAEFLLFARRGKPALARAFPSSVIVTARPPGRRHSQKPECFMDYIEACCPGPYLELFARRNRLGWDTYGNESLNHVDLVPSPNPKERGE
jgi:N6-adenosine-specific RNA methylase IME4